MKSPKHSCKSAGRPRSPGRPLKKLSKKLKGRCHSVKKSAKRSVKRSGKKLTAYNRFVRKYFKDHPHATLKKAASSWKKH